LSICHRPTYSPEKKCSVCIRKIDLSKKALDVTELARRTEGYASRHIKFLVNEASRNALKGREKLSLAQFEEVLEKRRPSIVKERLRS
jgi:SpoVK/Ycf46/Vps4 family AAA+-type ATPase